MKHETLFSGKKREKETDTQYNDKNRYNDNLNVTKPSLKR